MQVVCSARYRMRVAVSGSGAAVSGVVLCHLLQTCFIIYRQYRLHINTILFMCKNQNYDYFAVKILTKT